MKDITTAYRSAFRRVLALRCAVERFRENDPRKAATFLHRLKLAEQEEAELFKEIKN